MGVFGPFQMLSAVVNHICRLLTNGFDTEHQVNVVA